MAAYGRLDVFFPDGSFKTYLLTDSNTTIGRSTTSTIPINDDTLSRYHINITYQNGKVAITDLESANGTYVEGLKLDANTSRTLNGGEEIFIGDLRTIFIMMDDRPTRPDIGRLGGISEVPSPRTPAPPSAVSDHAMNRLGSLPEAPASAPLSIFISYKSEERPLIEILAAALTAHGHDVWFDKRLQGGQDWWNEICHNIRSRSVIVTALSPNYLMSKACRIEYEYAHLLNRHILPVEVVSLGNGIRKLPVQLQRRQIVRLLNGHHIDNAMLNDVLAHLEADQSMPDPLPPQPDAPISELSKLNDRVEAGALGDLAVQLGVIVILKKYLNGDDPNDRTFAREIFGKLQHYPDLKPDAVREVDTLINAFDRKSGNPINRLWRRGDR